VIDLFTVNLIVAIVTLTAGILYLVETLLRREVGAGRVWALAFLSGMLTVTAYLVWRASPEPWVAIAIGNASLVATAGFFWLGCRSFNGRGNRIAGAIMAAAVAAQLLATLVPGPRGGDWAGAVPMFIGIATFALLGAIESRRGNMGAIWSSLGFTVVLALVAVYYYARAVVLWTLGPDSELFSSWFSSSVTGIVSIVLTTVALTTATMLRSGRVTMRHEGGGATLQVSDDGILSAASYEAALPSVLRRAAASEELFAVVALRIDDLDQIGVAFGSVEQESIDEQWRSGVRRYAPTFSLVGAAADDAMLVAFEPASAADARRIASRIQRRVLDDVAERGSAVIPVMGVGIALSEDIGYDAGAVIDAAQRAARRSSTSPDASVIFADADERTDGRQSVRR
jgi:GGDEF domain-containing protein